MVEMMEGGVLEGRLSAEDCTEESSLQTFRRVPCVLLSLSTPALIPLWCFQKPPNDRAS